MAGGNATFSFTLTSAGRRELAKPVVGRGGHQSLLRRLQHQVNGKGVLNVSGSDLEMMLRYMSKYGAGGFQNRLAATTGRKSTKKR